MSEHSGEFSEPQLFPKDYESRIREVTSLRTALSQRLEEAGAADEDIVSLSTLDGRSMRISANTYSLEDTKGRDKRRGLLRRKSTRPATVKVYYLNLPPTSTTPPRSISVHTASLDGTKEIMTHHSDPDKGIEIDFPLPHKLDDSELRQAVGEATAILKDPITVTLGDDALFASEQLAPCDTIRGKEAQEIYEMIAPIFSESIDPDPRNIPEGGTAKKLYVVHNDQAPPHLAIRDVYVLQGSSIPDRNLISTSFIFAENPFGEGRHFSAHVNSIHNPNGDLIDLNVSYLQSLPGDTDRFPKTTAIALEPNDRMRVADAIQRQIIPANLTQTKPKTK